jgi:hypothetical protein
MRRTLKTATLVIALSCPAFAGEMETPPVPQPPPPSTAQKSTTGDKTDTETPSDSLTQFTLNLLALLPSLL